MEIGFTFLKSDPCACMYLEGSRSVVLALKVDDVLLVGRHMKVLEQIERKLASQFSMTDLAQVSLVLGMGVVRVCAKGTVTTTQDGIGGCGP